MLVGSVSTDDVAEAAKAVLRRFLYTAPYVHSGVGASERDWCTSHEVRVPDNAEPDERNTCSPAWLPAAHHPRTDTLVVSAETMHPASLSTLYSGLWLLCAPVGPAAFTRRLVAHRQGSPKGPMESMKRDTLTDGTMQDTCRFA